VHRTLIVAKLKPQAMSGIAETFEASDSSELPHLVGVSRRTLFSFHDLYFHLVEADADITPTLYKARSHPLYADINTKLQEFVSPYDPNWREPKDAMAKPFYIWAAEEGRVL
jgi:cyclase